MADLVAKTVPRRPHPRPRPPRRPPRPGRHAAPPRPPPRRRRPHRHRSPQIVQAPQNLALTQVYEPGSVFKLVTFSAALQDGIISPNEVFTVPNSLSIDGWVFHDAESHPTERLTATQILAQSSNIGTIEIAQQLGEGRLAAQIATLGFGQHHRTRLPGRVGRPGEEQPGDVAGVRHRLHAHRPGRRRHRAAGPRHGEHGGDRWCLRPAPAGAGHGGGRRAGHQGTHPGAAPRPVHDGGGAADHDDGAGGPGRHGRHRRCARATPWRARRARLRSPTPSTVGTSPVPTWPPSPVSRRPSIPSCRPSWCSSSPRPSTAASSPPRCSPRSCGTPCTATGSPPHRAEGPRGARP